MQQPIQVENFKKYPGSVKKASRKHNKVLFQCEEEALELSVFS